MASGQEGGPGEIEQLKRLIEIQRQIVELAEENRRAERQCDSLRVELVQSARAKSSLRGPRRIIASFLSLFGLFLSNR